MHRQHATRHHQHLSFSITERDECIITPEKVVRLNPLPFIIALIIGLLAYAAKGSQAAMIAVAVWLSFSLLLTIFSRES